MKSTSTYFNALREHISGYKREIQTPYGSFPLTYFDWTATGRGFLPIDYQMIHEISPNTGNTHSESNYIGEYSTKAYHHAISIIKEHVGANESDIVLGVGNGTTAAIIKLQNFLGFRLHEKFKSKVDLASVEKPVVFVTHMEHHSNHISWIETIADVVIVEPNQYGEVDPQQLVKALEKYQDRKIKIGSFAACSNVTGIETPYHELAKIMHQHDGFCFVDFAASAPYVPINMHPENPDERLDAIFFSPHKFLGGHRTCGILIFNECLYNNAVPDYPGGGTVLYTTPWEARKYYDDIQIREDGGTPPFLQIIQVSMCLLLKEEMLKNGMQEQKDYLLHHLWTQLNEIKGVTILEGEKSKRQGIVSFYVEGIHHSLLSKLLSQRYGIQVRPGCSCAGTYGHYLLNIGPEESRRITSELDKGILSSKPGWVRISLHPTNTLCEINSFIVALHEIISNINIWEKDYVYCETSNEYRNILENELSVSSLFTSWKDKMVQSSVKIK